MRCERCDRPSVPASVGWTPAGVLVFGWCPECMADHECRLVEVAGLAEALGPAPGREPPAFVTRAREPKVASSRLVIVRRLVAVIAAWAGVVLIVAALALTAAEPRTEANPLPNGHPSALIIGGLALAGFGLWLAWLTLPRPKAPTGGPAVKPVRHRPEPTRARRGSRRVR